MTPRELLSAKGIDQDFTHDNPSVLDYIHRRTGEAEIYFIRNTSGEFYSGTCSFRVSDFYPELWDPSTGKQSKPEMVTTGEGRTEIMIDLDTGASLFVVFTRNERSVPVHPHKLQQRQNSRTIDGSWRVTFPDGWGAPPEATFEKLISWTDSEIDGIKYFSGMACYHKNITFQEEEIQNYSSIEINLGKVCDVAEVYLNGKSAGILWKDPFTLDITDLVQAGENKLKIEIVNQWVNRLTGDMLSDPENRYCRTNQPYITSDDQGYDNWIGDSDETFSLKTSGLLGPVELLFSPVEEAAN
jgi:hypothetical protein